MSNQLQITGGAKVRSLEGVITGTSGVLSSVPYGGANGVATLDSGGKVPVSQLPSSVVTYLGTWNAATNTPTLVNGTGDAGDLYICNVAGTANFGAGPITFAVGDWVLYGSGTWQKSNGQNGTVTSVAASITGSAIGITGSPITTAGTLAFAFAGTNLQYVNGAGDLTTFPSLTGYIPYTGATSSIDLNNQSVVNISHLGINTTSVPTILLRAIGDNNSSSRIAMRGYSSNANSSSIRVTKFRGTAGAPQAPLSGDSLGKFELAGYGTTSSEGYPQASFEGIATENWGATARGTKTVIKITPNTTITQAIALTINQDKSAVFESSVTGTSIIKTGGTSNQFLKADGSVDSNLYVQSVSGTAPVVSSGGNTPYISMHVADTYNDGYLSSANWNTFNNKANASGTTAQVAFYNGSNSLTSSSQFWYFNSYSRLGIGDFSAITPVAALSTISTVGAWYNRTTAAASYNGIGLSFDSGGYGHLFQTDKVGTAPSANVSFLNNNTALSLDENYNVGINTRVPTPGTTGPGGVGLDIFGGSSTAALALHNTASGLTTADGGRLYLTTSGGLVLRNFESGGISITADTGDITVIQGGSEKIKVAYGGYVGIMAPASITQALTVNGNVLATSHITSGGTSSQFVKGDGSLDSNTYGTITSVTATAPVVSTGGNTPVISMAAATASVNGYLTAANFTTFNNKFTLPSLTSGSVLFSDGTTIAQDNTNFFFDNTYKALKIISSSNGLETGNPYPLHVKGVNSIIMAENTNTTGTAAIRIKLNTYIQSTYQYSSLVGATTLSSNYSDLRLLSGSGNGIWIANSTGNVSINNFTDSGYKLDVSGTGRFSSNFNVIFSNTSGVIDNNAFLRLVNTGTSTLNQSIDILMRWQDGTYNGSGGISMVRESATARSGKLILQPIDSSGNNIAALTLTSTGAATFSSSVQANANFISNTTTDTPSVGTSAANNATYNYLGYSGYWGLRTTTTGNNFALDTYNGGTPKNVLTITQAGNVGIGTSGTSFPLEVLRDTTGNATINVRNPNGTSGSGASIRLYSSGYDNMPAEIINKPDATGGTTLINIRRANGSYYDVVTFRGDGNVYNYNNTTTWNTTSDIRVKENINTIENSLDVILKLNPVSFDYKDEFANKKQWEEKQKLNNIGFIAQEFETVFPKYVTYSDDIINNEKISDFRSIDTGHLVAYLVKAIQESHQIQLEQNQTIQQLKERLDKLENK
jgi:hypothetical protein